MRFYENRLVWETGAPQEGGPSGGEVLAEGDEEDQDELDDGTKVAPEQGGEDIQAAQDGAAVEQAQAAAQAEAIAQQADNLPGDNEGSGGNTPGDGAGGLGSMVPENIVQEIEEKGAYNVAYEYTQSKFLALVLTVLYFMYKDELLSDPEAAAEEQGAIDDMRENLQQEYQTKVDALAASGKLPGGITVEDTDPSLIKQFYGIQNPAELEARLEGKSVVEVPAGTSLFDYLDKLESQGAAVQPDPNAPVVDPDWGPDQQEDGEGDAGNQPEPVEDGVDPLPDAVPVQPEAEPEGPFKRCPTGAVDLAHGEIAPFILPSGDKVMIDRTCIRINGRRFRVEALGGLNLWFDKVEPEGDGFRLHLRTEAQMPLGGGPLKSDSARLSGAEIVDFISYLVANASNNQFSKTVQRPPDDEGREQDPVTFDFIAA